MWKKGPEREEKYVKSNKNEREGSTLQGKSIPYRSFPSPVLSNLFRAYPRDGHRQNECTVGPGPKHFRVSYETFFG